MDLKLLHNGFSNAIFLFSVVMGLWAFFNAWRHAPLAGDYWGALVLGELLCVAQAVVGIGMLLQGAEPGRLVHLLYGTLAVITWPAAYGFLYQRNMPHLDDRRQALLFGLICLFMAGIALRASSTAHA